MTAPITFACEDCDTVLTGAPGAIARCPYCHHLQDAPDLAGTPIGSVTVDADSAGEALAIALHYYPSWSDEHIEMSYLPPDRYSVTAYAPTERSAAR